MTEQEWIGQQWPTAEKLALRKAVVDLIGKGWQEANLTLLTRGAVAVALEEVESQGLNAAAVRKARAL